MRRLSCGRLERASASVVRLFKRYPEIMVHTSYVNKAPISRSDSPKLMIRKSLRALLSAAPSLFLMKSAVRILARKGQDVRLLALLYRWVLGAHMVKGYRRGLLESRNGQYVK